ncbi:MAG: tetratricopeptide repeat protein [Bryobacteraceae bacterium]|nr:tetratricopeptide repeat protein [Bryobacteraceae bacterium]
MSKCVILTLHALVLAPFCRAGGLDPSEWERLLMETQRLSARGEYEEARAAAGRALAEAEKFGSGDPRVAATLSQIGYLCHVFGEYSEAEKAYLRGIQILDHRADQRRTLSELLDNLASLYTEFGSQYEKADRLRRRALEIGLAELGQDHPEVAILLSNLATTCMARRRFDEAKPLLLRALALLETNRAAYKSNAAGVLGNLAVLTASTNHLEESADYARRGLALDEQTLGPIHPRLSRPLLNLARLQMLLGRPASAGPLAARALALAEAAYGEEHPLVSEILFTYAAALKETGRKKEARGFERRARDIAARHPDRVIAGASVHLSALASESDVRRR